MTDFPTGQAAPGATHPDLAGPAAGRQQRLVVVGAGRAAVQVLDILSRCADQVAVALVDDEVELHGRELFGVPVIGAIDRGPELIRAGAADALVVASGNPARRSALWQRLRTAGSPFANVVDPTVAFGLGASIGTGNVIGANSRIGACSVLGDNLMLSSSVNVEHDNVVGSHTTSGPGLHTAGSVRIGERVAIGAGVVMDPHVEVGDDCLISSGLALMASVPAASAAKARAIPVVRPRWGEPASPAPTAVPSGATR